MPTPALRAHKQSRNVADEAATPLSTLTGSWHPKSADRSIPQVLYSNTDARYTERQNRSCWARRIELGRAARFLYEAFLAPPKATTTNQQVFNLFLALMETRTGVATHVVMDADIQALQAACETGQTDELEELLARVSESSGDSSEAIHRCFIIACNRGHIAMVKTFLQHPGSCIVDVNCLQPGATPHVPMKHALLAACSAGHLHVVRELLALQGHRAVDVGAQRQAALLAACKGGHTAIVTELLALQGHRRLDVHLEDDLLFKEACRWGNLGTLHELLALQGDRRIGPAAVGGEEGGFVEACCHGRTAVVQALLTLGDDRQADPRENDCACLCAAARGGHVGVVALLLHTGVDVHARDDAVFVTAFRGGYWQLLDLLLEQPLAMQPPTQCVLGCIMVDEAALALLASRHCSRPRRAQAYVRNALHRCAAHMQRVGGMRWGTVVEELFGPCAIDRPACAATVGFGPETPLSALGVVGSAGPLRRLALRTAAQGSHWSHGSPHPLTPAEARVLEAWAMPKDAAATAVLLAALRAMALPCTAKGAAAGLAAALVRAEPVQHRQEALRECISAYAWGGLAANMWRGAQAPPAAEIAQQRTPRSEFKLAPLRPHPALCRHGRRRLLLHRVQTRARHAQRA